MAILAPALSTIASLQVGARIAIVGSRTFPALGLVRELVAALPADCIVCSGAAAGIDQCAAAAAQSRGLAIDEWPADWASLGRAAGVVRSAALIKTCSLVVVFLCCGSKGSTATIALARRAGIPCVVIPCGCPPAIDSLWG